jgi:hypothetical protein
MNDTFSFAGALFDFEENFPQPPSPGKTVSLGPGNGVGPEGSTKTVRFKQESYNLKQLAKTQTIKEGKEGYLSVVLPPRVARMLNVNS